MRRGRGTRADAEGLHWGAGHGGTHRGTGWAVGGCAEGMQSGVMRARGVTERCRAWRGRDRLAVLQLDCAFGSCYLSQSGEWAWGQGVAVAFRRRQDGDWGGRLGTGSTARPT